MNASPDIVSRPESFPRVILCRLFCLVAILSLWHVPDWAAAAIYGAGVLAYYVPSPAASRCPPPVWLRPAWFFIGAVIAAVYFFNGSPAPAGSVVPPEFKYGMLALLAIQVAADLHRRKRLRVV